MTSTAIAHANLALIKYWGKRNEALRLPFAPSLSLTLDSFYTKTSISAFEGAGHEFVLDGEKVKGPDAERVFKYLDLLQGMFSIRKSFKVQSWNFVPKSAGFASSSSAFCALAAAFCSEIGAKASKKEVSILARLGSGSACRSAYGGFVLWKEGRESSESFAFPLEGSQKMAVAILSLIFKPGKKEISSTEGMRRSTGSPYFPLWVGECRRACLQAKEAIREGSLKKLGMAAEQNACEMHALTLASRPPFTYLSGKSLLTLSLAQSLREEGVECYWTCDAGSNPAFICNPAEAPKIEERARETFGPGLRVRLSRPGPGVEAWHED